MEGPLVGGSVGLIFGLFSFLRGGAALFSDPIIAILPRVLIGVLSLGVVRGYLPNWETAATIAVTHGIPEVIIAVLITVAIAKGIQKSRLVA